MLVLARRTDQKIVFPNIGITVQVLNIRGNVVKVGINAPSDVTILRKEIADNLDGIEPQQDEQLGWLSPTTRHYLRNRLNTVTIGLHLSQRQLNAGLVADAESTLQKVLTELGTLNEEFARSAPREKSPGVKRPCRTLVVEDNSNERELLAGYLRLSGCEVDTAGDGADALDYLSTHARPDLVILDMKMPRCDGAKTVEMIRRNPDFDGLTVVAVSGAAPGQMGVATGPRGIDRWFPKPLNPEMLVRELNLRYTPRGQE